MSDRTSHPVGTPGRPPDPRLDAYLDQQLSPSDRAAFERDLATDPALRAELELQTSIDTSIRRRFVYVEPSPAEMLRPAGPRPLAARRWTRVLAAAAMLALVGAVAAYFLLRSPEPSRMSPERFYSIVEAGGWKPSWTCKSEPEFATAVSKQFQLKGESLAVPFDTPGMTLVGWTFATQYPRAMPLSDRCLNLFATVDGKPVLVLMDHLRNDREIKPSDPCLNVFRREVGPIVTYEITPLTEPRVIPTAHMVKIAP